MALEGIPAYGSWRIVDADSGAIIVPNLYHLHQSSYEIQALQAGITGSSTMGQFSIKLPAPQSDDFKAHASDYRALAAAWQAGQDLKAEYFEGLETPPNYLGSAAPITSAIASGTGPLIDQVSSVVTAAGTNPLIHPTFSVQPAANTKIIVLIWMDAFASPPITVTDSTGLNSYTHDSLYDALNFEHTFIQPWHCDITTNRPTSLNVQLTGTGTIAAIAISYTGLAAGGCSGISHRVQGVNVGTGNTSAWCNTDMDGSRVVLYTAVFTIQNTLAATGIALAPGPFTSRGIQNNGSGGQAGAVADAIGSGEELQAKWTFTGDTTSTTARDNVAIYSWLVSATTAQQKIGPTFTGVITGIDMQLNNVWTVQGSDTVWWLQAAQSFPGEDIGAQTTASNAINNALSTREVVWDDDFSGKYHTPSDYRLWNNTGTMFVNWGADPFWGLPAALHNAAGINRMLTKQTWPADGVWGLANNFASATDTVSFLTMQGLLDTSAGVTTGQLAGLEILALGQGLAMLLCLITLDWTGTNSLAWSAQFWTGDNTGTFTAWGSNTTNILPFTSIGRPPFVPFDFSLIMGFNTSFDVKLLINGQDTGVVIPYQSGFGTTVPHVGAAGFTNRSATTTPLYLHRFSLETRVANAVYFSNNWSNNARFRKNAITTTGAPGLPTQWGQSAAQTNLDRIQTVASYAGVQLRKDPGIGPRGDTITYTNKPADASFGWNKADGLPPVAAVFEEGVNLIADGTKLATIPDLYANGVRMNGIPAGNSGGSITYRPARAAGTQVLIDTVTDIGLSEFAMLLRYAHAVGDRKAMPQTAIQVQAVRTAEAAAVRELDFVTVHIPTLGINRQTAQVVGKKYTEGDATITFYLNQIPGDAFSQSTAQRLLRSHEFISTIFKSR